MSFEEIIHNKVPQKRILDIANDSETCLSFFEFYRDHPHLTLKVKKVFHVITSVQEDERVLKAALTAVLENHRLKQRDFVYMFNFTTESTTFSLLLKCLTTADFWQQNLLMNLKLKTVTTEQFLLLCDLCLTTFFPVAFRLLKSFELEVPINGKFFEKVVQKAVKCKSINVSFMLFRAEDLFMLMGKYPNSNVFVGARTGEINGDEAKFDCFVEYIHCHYEVPGCLQMLFNVKNLAVFVKLLSATITRSEITSFLLKRDDLTSTEVNLLANACIPHLQNNGCLEFIEHFYPKISNKAVFNILCFPYLLNSLKSELEVRVFVLLCGGNFPNVSVFNKCLPFVLDCDLPIMLNVVSMFSHSYTKLFIHELVYNCDLNTIVAVCELPNIKIFENVVVSKFIMRGKRQYIWKIVNALKSKHAALIAWSYNLNDLNGMCISIDGGYMQLPNTQILKKFTDNLLKSNSYNYEIGRILAFIYDNSKLEFEIGKISQYNVLTGRIVCGILMHLKSIQNADNAFFFLHKYNDYINITSCIDFQTKNEISEELIKAMQCVGEAKYIEMKDQKRREKRRKRKFISLSMLVGGSMIFALWNFTPIADYLHEQGVIS